MLVHGYELISEWGNSQCGQTARAQKGSRSYFLKKYKSCVAPINNGALDARTYEHNEAVFRHFVKTRTGINACIRSVSGAGGNIIIPDDEFIDENYYVEATEFVAGAVSDEELEGVLMSLSTDVKKLLMQTAAGALSAVHGKRIVHSDLKLKNILLVRNERTGNYVAKLIDFDSSFFVDEKPEEIVGTIDYYSPELGAYAASEDDEEREALGSRINEKTDIFSLGLIFHFYLSGAFPEPVSLPEKLRRRKEKGKVIYCWVALNNGCELQLSPKIDNPVYRSLISDMLNVDPEKRPTASEVLKRLKEADAVIEEPWPAHRIVLNRAKMSEAGIVGLKKVIISSQSMYELCYRNGKKSAIRKEDLVSAGYAASAVSEHFCEPWDGHEIEFDIGRMKARGFVCCEREELDGRKGYRLTRADSSTAFIGPEQLMVMQYAKKHIAAPAAGADCFDEPWPEHHIRFVPDNIRSRGYVRLKRTSLGTVRGYNLTRSDGTVQFFRAEMALIQKLANRV